MSTRAIRGAIQIEEDSVSAIRSGVVELLQEVLRSNALSIPDVISVILTATPELLSDFPAVGARDIGFGSVALLCASEINVAGALPRVIRVMLHCETDKSAGEITHVYLKGAQALRKDLAQ